MVKSSSSFTGVPNRGHPTGKQSPCTLHYLYRCAKGLRFVAVTRISERHAEKFYAYRRTLITT